MEKPIGEVLSQWRIYLTNISRNLMELSEQTDVKLIKLKARGTANGYTGLTKVKAVQCVESLETLWQYYALLAQAIDKAITLNSKNSFLNNTEDEIRKILETDSIVIKSERIAINNRDLLSSGNNEKKITPQALLKYMQDSFESLCKDITEISEATQIMQSRLSNIKVDINKLNSTVTHLGISNISAFDITAVAKFETDPLQGLLELDKLIYNIEKYRASIKSIEEEYSKVIISFGNIKGKLIELEDLYEKLKIAIMEAEKLFGTSHCTQPVISEEVIQSLRDWLQILESKLSQGSLKAVKIGVIRLEAECSSKLELVKVNYELNCKDYNEWMDLKGQFRALLAKSEAMKTKGIFLDVELDELAKSTADAIYAKNINLDTCRKLVRKFELSLKG
jgi:hypothetical protein